MEVLKEPRANNKRFNKVNLFKVIKWPLMILILILVFWSGTKLSEKFEHDEKALSFGFKDMGFLITQEWYGRILEDSKVDRSFFDLFTIPLTESRQIFSIDFEVFAGIEFEDINYTVDHKKKEINVSLPHAIIQNTSPVADSMKVYLDSESWFSRIDLESNEKARQSMQKNAEQLALDSGILEKAENNAEKLIANMIKGNGECAKNACIDYNFEFNYE